MYDLLTSDLRDDLLRLLDGDDSRSRCSVDCYETAGEAHVDRWARTTAEQSWFSGWEP
jgi:hypothetical protein